jgi:hypothetical protein
MLGGVRGAGMGYGFVMRDVCVWVCVVGFRVVRELGVGFGFGLVGSCI